MKIIDMDAHPPFDTANIDYIGEIDRTEFFARLERAGISKACGTLLPPPGFFTKHTVAEAVEILNEKTMELALSEARYIPVLWVHPDCADVSLKKLEQYIPVGARIIEVDADWLERMEMHRIFEYAQEQHVAVSLIGGTFEQVITLTSKFPRLKVLVGGVSDQIFAPPCAKEIMEICPEVYIKLSRIMWTWNYVMHEWSKCLDKERLLFGTGYPDCNPAAKLGAFEWELRDWSETERELIFCENALRITTGG